jgi:hypothetical protein
MTDDGGPTDDRRPETGDRKRGRGGRSPVLGHRSFVPSSVAGPRSSVVTLPHTFATTGSITTASTPDC